MGNKFDTAELNDIRRLLGEEVPRESEKIAKPAPQTESSRTGGRTFDLDDDFGRGQRCGGRGTCRV